MLGLGALALSRPLGMARAETGAETGSDSALAFLPIRYSTMLVRIGGVSVLIDAGFADALRLQGLAAAPPAPVSPRQLGPIDLLLVTSNDPGCVDAQSLAQLDLRDAFCLAGDEGAGRRLQQAGVRRVRVVSPGDRVSVRGLDVDCSPGRALWGGRGVGYRVSSRAGRTLWHTGTLSPLSVDASPAVFARLNRSEVVACCAQGLRVRGDSGALTMDRADALALAQLCGARAALPLLTDARPAGLAGWVLETEPNPRPTDMLGPAGGKAPQHVIESRPGVWFQLAPAPAARRRGNAALGPQSG